MSRPGRCDPSQLVAHPSRTVVLRALAGLPEPIGIHDLAIVTEIPEHSVRDALRRPIVLGMVAVTREPRRNNKGSPTHRYRITAEGRRFLASLDLTERSMGI